MDENVRFLVEQRMERTKKALEKNGMEAYIVPTAAEVVPLVKQLLAPGCTVSNGGSQTLKECGVLELLETGGYQYQNRSAPGANKRQVELDTFSFDAFLASANAITENGEILEMDGYGNRVAAIAYGPPNVILVAGHNKIVPDLEAARRRNAQVSAPANCHRLDCNTPCAKTGVCVDCSSPGRICCIELILHKQLTNGRIKVILVGEELGY